MNSLFNTIIPILLFCFIYLGFMALIKSYNRTKLLKFLSENNLLNNLEGDGVVKIPNILDGDSKDSKPSKKINMVLTLSLGLIGLAVGIILGALIMIPLMDMDYVDKSVYRTLKEAVTAGFPMLFAALGVLTAYFIDKKER